MYKLLPHQQKIGDKRYFQLEEKTWPDLIERVWPAVMKPDFDLLEEKSSVADEAEQERLRTTLGKMLIDCKDLLLERKFLFNTPTWINAGLPGARTLSACFVGELKDSMLGPGGILDCSTWFGTVQKFGGGTGIDLTPLRPKGTPINSTHGKACGPLMVLKYLAATSQMITQGGARDGANMAVMSVYHEDIVEFIKCKAIESKYLLELPLEVAQQKVDAGEWTFEAGQTYIEYCKKMGVFQLFNVSVAIDDEFMSFVQDYVAYGLDPEGAWETDPSWEKKLPCGKSIAEIWDMIVEQAHASGDPGLLFIERAQRLAIFHSPYIPSATNPCGEQWLPDDGSCNLGSIDLAKFVVNQPTILDPPAYLMSIDWIALEECIKLSVRMLDNVVSVNKHPVDKIGKVNEEERRIGLGIMGWADLLFKLKIPYNSDEALKLAETVASFFQKTAHQASVNLAVERGPFPLWDQVEKFCQQSDSPMPSEPRRNATVTTVAPTGTISLMAGCSSGIEPHFMLGYEHSGLAEHGGLGYIWASDTLREEYENFLQRDDIVLSNEPDHLKLVMFEEHIRYTHGWKPANEISIEYHVYHQAIWQKHIDNSISKTLNLANNATVFQVAQTYLLSYSQGCKGSTVYRDGCKPFQPLNASKVPTEEIVDSSLDSSPTQADIEREMKSIDMTYLETVTPGERIKKKRDKIAHGVTIKEKTGDGSLYVTINRGFRDEPFELFATVGKAGGKAAAYTEAIGRLISMALQYNIPIEEIKKELRGISAGDPVGFGPERILSVPDGIGKAIEEFLDYEQGEAEDIEVIESAPIASTVQYGLVDACPECGAQLFRQAGCSGGTCLACGYAKCQ